jgi:hypothetical protein
MKSLKKLNFSNSVREFENRALRDIFGKKRDEVRRQRKRLCNEERFDLYF